MADFEIDDIALERELLSRDYYEFVKAAFHLPVPGDPYMDNWHIKAICDHLQEVYEAARGRETDVRKRLCINIPPAHMKTLLTSGFFVAWVWTRWPEARFVYTSFNEKAAIKILDTAKAVLESKWYEERWGHVWNQSKNWSATRIMNSKRGEVYALPADKVIGKHANFLFVDDPIDPKKVASRLERETLNNVVNQLDTRLLKNGILTIIMQRLHEEDPAGIAIASKEYDVICFPAFYQKDLSMFGLIKDLDPRTKVDEVLWPERLTQRELEARRKRLGKLDFAAQYQQRPVPAEGHIFAYSDIQYWKEFPRGGIMIQSWDLAFKGNESSDYVVGQVWVRNEGNFYLIDQVRKKMDFSETCQAIQKMKDKYPGTSKIIVEDKANGPAIINHLKDKVPGLVPVNPKGGKLARAFAVQPLWQAGNVYIPAAEKKTWVDAFIYELTTFDKSPNDDQVDAMTQALTELNGKQFALGRYVDFVRKSYNRTFGY